MQPKLTLACVMKWHAQLLECRAWYRIECGQMGAHMTTPSDTQPDAIIIARTLAFVVYR